jgi:hypothetical protein
MPQRNKNTPRQRHCISKRSSPYNVDFPKGKNDIRTWPGFETSEKAFFIQHGCPGCIKCTPKSNNSICKGRIDLLRSSAKRINWNWAEAASKLADKFSDCAPTKYACGSPACAVCLRRYRINMIAAIDRFFPRGKDFLFITLLSKDWVVHENEIFSLKAKNIVNTVRYQLDQCGLKDSVPVIGFIDGEYNAEKKQFCLHMHLLMPPFIADILKDSLGRYYTKGKHNEIFHRPMDIRSLGHENDRERTLLYMIKTYWGRVMESEKSKSRNGKVRKAIQGRPHNLYLLWLNQYKFSELRLLYGVRLKNNDFVISCVKRK